MTTKDRAEIASEAIFAGGFIVSCTLGAITLLNVNTVVLTNQAKAWVGYALLAYAAIAFGYIVFKAFEGKHYAKAR